MKTGVYDGISNADYHSRDGHYSSTLIKKMDVPARARHYMHSEHEHKECFAFGSAVHAYILEPDVFRQWFLIPPTWARRSESDRIMWAKWFDANGADGCEITSGKAATWHGEFMRQTGKTIVTVDDVEKIKAMSESLASNKLAIQLLENGKPELSVYWTDDETGLLLKARPDYMNADFISDIKSCQSIADRDITRAILNLGYGISQAMYQDGCHKATGEWRTFVFIFIEKEPPFLCRVIELDEEAQAAGNAKYQHLKRTLRQCLETDTWPGIDNNMEFSLPDWYTEPNFT